MRFFCLLKEIGIHKNYCWVFRYDKIEIIIIDKTLCPFLSPKITIQIKNRFLLNYLIFLHWQYVAKLEYL